ncbi:prolyl oligopeptidase family serine peptidase [Kitasatospora sp. SUK 42]|uniref:S9 family peptidase n=1 Tax=Kitasatospora sp. SUK 42 TaxID=1588882 RepID=UPI0018CA8A6E|nr:prolyl oligopeptidase family serine peptidase [Kitasatospora sp. SUK 42]MBV2155724.1 prolyl oligopeptidase family serine peptidase [Kitasatospora sp. SUK 42]
MTFTDAFLSLSARTGRFTFGAPSAHALSEDGTRVLLLRSTGPEDPVNRLHLLDVTTGEERLVADPTALAPGRSGERDELPAVERRLRERTRLVAAGIGTYAATADLATAVFALDGRLFRTDTATGTSTELPTAGPAFDPRPDATGERVAYVADDALYVTPEPTPLSPADGARWGVAEFAAAEELGRARGHWWRPDGGALLAARVDESALPRRYFADPARPGEPGEDFAYPQAGGPNADVQLWVLGLDGARVRLRWDAEEFPYVCAASWASDDEVLLTVADRLQQNVLLLTAEPATGETRELSRTTDEFWVDDLPGTPARLPDGRLLTVHDTPQARGLALDGEPLDTTGLQIRRVVGRFGGALLCETGQGDPADQYVHLVDPDGGAPVLLAGDPAEGPTGGPGVHSALAAGDTLLLTSATAEGIRRVVRRAGHELPLTDLSAALPYTVRPRFERVTERGLPTAVVYPREHVPGRRLPVLLDVYGGPGYQAVATEPRRWQLRQWWADQGFAVVTTDNRGTPFVSPDFTRAIFRRFSLAALDDQVDALHALAAHHPDLDLGRVGVRGWSYGGYFAALAVLRRPDVFHAACAGAPPTDFRLYDTAYTERYLGLPQDNPEGYAADCLLTDAPGLTRPLLLIHGLADDNVHPSHTLLLSQELTRAGRPHGVLPLPGVTHMTPGGVNEQVAAAELAFLQQSLG